MSSLHITITGVQMLIKNLMILVFIFAGTAMAEVMTIEDKLIATATMVKYSGQGGLIALEPGEYLMLLDVALQQGYKPSPALLQALDDQPGLLQKTQERAAAQE